MTTKTCTALILEDEPLIALDLEFMFETAGFPSTKVSESCAHALEWLKTETPTIALLDIQLKDGPCTEVATILQARNVPVLVCSGTHPSDAHAVFSSGIWLPKPISPDRLVAALRGVLHAAGPADAG